MGIADTTTCNILEYFETEATDQSISVDEVNLLFAATETEPEREARYFCFSVDCGGETAAVTLTEQQALTFCDRIKERVLGA